MSVTVPCRYSPATAKMPKISVNSAARATCARALPCTAGSCTSPPDWTRPVTPATTSSGPAASSSHGLRTVLSLRNSLRIKCSTVALLGSRRPAAGQPGGGGQLEERRFQGVVGRADLVQRAGEAHLPGADDHHVIDGLGDLAEHVAGHDDGPALVREAAQQAAQPGDAGRVEPVGRLVEQQHLRVPEQRRSQAQALAHAQGEPAHPPPGGRGEIDLSQDLVHPAAGDARGVGDDAQVVPGPAPRMEAGRLEHRADRVARPGEAAVRHTADQCRSGVGPDQAEHDAQRGGLPRAVRPQKAGHLPGRGGEGHPLHRGDPPEDLRQVPDLDLSHPASSAPGIPAAPYEQCFMNSSS